MATITRSAAADEAHAGDIRGALGTISLDDTAPRAGLSAKLKTLLAIVGPGLIVMCGDNDVGAFSTYGQAGQNYGTRLLWTLLLLVPVLYVNQEMVLRLGAVTGVGHARLIIERFGKSWAMLMVADLIILNALTLVTEFIGVSLALGHFGVSPYISVPLTALLLIGATVSGSFVRWERLMFVFIAANFLIIPLAVFSHPQPGPILHGLVLPGVQGGLTGTSVLLIIAIVGTTVAPWQLFFQQSNIVDKRITPRWISYERFDTILGSFVTVVGAIGLVVTCAFAFQGTRFVGHFADAGATADALRQTLGPVAGAMYAIVLLNASLIGAAALALATSYAVGDTFGIRHSLHVQFGEAPAFYSSFIALVLCAAGIVLIPRAPLGLITTAVQALAGILLPSASTFLLILCNDRAVLGPWVNRPWVNAIAAVIISALLMLSAILTITTLFPGVDATRLTEVLGLGLALALGGAGIWAARQSRSGIEVPRPSREERESWTMAPLALLDRPEPSAIRRVGMRVMGGYLAIAVLLLIVKSVQLATGHA